MVEIFKVSYKVGNINKEGYFIKNPHGYLQVLIRSNEFIEKFPEGAKIEEADINILGRLVKKNGKDKLFRI